MKDKVPLLTEPHRIREGVLASDPSYGFNGAFMIPLNPKGGPQTVLTVVISDQKRWDHVSVSTPHRCPTWEEMSAIKGIFFKDTETVFQYHPKRSRYINQHPYCLHMWRPHRKKIPLPPSWMVGE